MSEAWEAIFRKTESPIELMLAKGIERELGWPAHPGSIDDVPISALGGHGALVFAQQPIGRYRADFVIAIQGEAWHWPALFVVECDGYAWHSSPEAIERDRIRDELMGSLDLNPLRLSGYEIVRWKAWRDLPDLMGIWETDWKLRGSYEGADEFYATLRAERRA